MDTMSAVLMGIASRGNRPKVFDWVKCAQIIKENGVRNADAGLFEDWNATGGAILKDGKPVPEEDTYTFLMSTWATPYLEIEGVPFVCWIYQDESPGWNEKTYWPKEALDILNNVIDGEFINE